MKYLIINGSPHRGNTWTVVQAAMKRIKELDANYTAEEIHLMEARIPFCTGCSNCFRLGGEFCPHRDIMSEIQTKIEAADGIIVATTTFNCRETALLKNFLDHLNYLLHRPRFFNKKALVVTTVGGVGGNATIKSVTGTLRGMGFNKCYSMFIRSVSWNDYRINTSDQKKISREAEKFYTDLKSGKMHYPTTEVLIPYNIFRGMAGNFVHGSEFETEDGTYCSDVYRKNHVYDKSIPLMPHQKLVGAMFYCLGKISSKHMVVTYKK